LDWIPIDATMVTRCFAFLLLALVSTAPPARTFAFVPKAAALVAVVPRTKSSSLSVAVDTSEIKNGMTVEIDGEPYKVLHFSIMKQARGAAKTTIKFKNLVRGTTIENTYRSGEKFETAMIERKQVQFTYQDEVRVWEFGYRWTNVGRLLVRASECSFGACGKTHSSRSHMSATHVCTFDLRLPTFSRTTFTLWTLKRLKK
jgi:hypothetical protein